MPRTKRCKRTNNSDSSHPIKLLAKTSRCADGSIKHRHALRVTSTRRQHRRRLGKTSPTSNVSLRLMYLKMTQRRTPSGHARNRFEQQRRRQLGRAANRAVLMPPIEKLGYLLLLRAATSVAACCRSRRLQHRMLLSGKSVSDVRAVTDRPQQ